MPKELSSRITHHPVFWVALQTCIQGAFIVGSIAWLMLYGMCYLIYLVVMPFVTMWCNAMTYLLENPFMVLLLYFLLDTLIMIQYFIFQCNQKWKIGTRVTVARVLFALSYIYWILHRNTPWYYLPVYFASIIYTITMTVWDWLGHWKKYVSIRYGVP